jgi:hypothetical protein
MEPDEADWRRLTGGYRQPYDPRGAIKRLADGDSSAWDELWEELHHQGDVGEASYAALIDLVHVHSERGVADWNTYAIAATIEEARRNGRNPPVPGWLAAGYEEAWRQLVLLGLRDFPNATERELVDSIIAVLAIAKDRRTLASFAMLTEDEKAEMLGQIGGA